MARLFPHYALAEKIGTHEVAIDARTVRELLECARQRYGERFATRGAAILVNGVNVTYLDGAATPLGPDDQVWLVVPAGGG